MKLSKRLPLLLLFAVPLLAQAARPARPPASAPRETAAINADYLIGVEDVLSVSVWKEPELSKNLNVRPDGKITVPLIGDLQAAGKTPEQLAASIAEGLARFLGDPIVT